MNLTKAVSAIVVTLLIVSSAGASNSVIYFPSGGGGSGNTTYNITYITYLSAMNQTPNMTPNMTPGAPGAPGVPGLPGTPGLPGLPGYTPVFGVDYFNGSDGAPGATGATGATGAQGVNGTPGADGAQGIQGIQGINGTPGADGAQGIQGINGTPGADGAQGIQGVNGTPGIDGIQGIQGVNGTPGADGAQGIQGVNGTPGWDGAAGINGTDGTSAYVYGNEGQVLYNIGDNATTSQCMGFNNVTDTFYACYITGDGTGITNVTAVDNTSYFLRDGSRAMTGDINVGNNNILQIRTIGGGDYTDGGGEIKFNDTFGVNVIELKSYHTLPSPGSDVIVSISAQTTAVTNISLNNHRISEVTDPTSTQDAATKNYVDGASKDNTTYFLRDGSRSMTGLTINRNMANSTLSVTGGNATHTGGLFVVGGVEHASTGGFYVYVPDAAGTGYKLLMSANGKTDTPILNLNSNRIYGVANPTSAQDAATMSSTNTSIEYPSFLSASAQTSTLCYNSATKKVTYNSGVTTCLSSTEKTKKNITDTTSMTSKLMQLKPVMYTSDVDGQRHYGLTAEQIAPIFPELVAYNIETGEPSGVRYEEFTSVLLKGFQEQQVTLNAICNNDPKLCEIKP